MALPLKASFSLDFDSLWLDLITGYLRKVTFVIPEQMI